MGLELEMTLTGPLPEKEFEPGRGSDVDENIANHGRSWSYCLRITALRELSVTYLAWMLPLPRTLTPNFWRPVVTLED
tara:strand:+ start:419 stop:652 length:234 start_codon:yes stop_codon:yes gene_type:complete